MALVALVSPQAVVPTARSNRLVLEHLADETLIYDLERDEAHHLNSTAAAVFALCDGRATVAQVAEGAGERLGQAVSTDAVSEALEGLAAVNLLDGAPQTEPGVSRREVVRKAALVGAGAAAAAPLIESIVAPTPAMAQTNGRTCDQESNRPNDCPCESSSQCGSGCCSNGSGSDPADICVSGDGCRPDCCKQ